MQQMQLWRWIRKCHLSGREVVKIQNEFYDIYQKDDLEKLEDFSKQLDIIAEGYKAQGL